MRRDPTNLPPFLGWAATQTARPVVHLLMASLDDSPLLRAACTGKVKMQQQVLDYEPDADLRCKACLRIRRERQQAALSAAPKPA